MLQSWKPNTYQLTKKTSSWWQLHLDPGTWENVCKVDKVYLITEELWEKRGDAKYISTVFLSFFPNLGQLWTRKSIIFCKGRASITITDGVEAFDRGNRSPVNGFRLLNYDIVWIILHLWTSVISHQWDKTSFQYSTTVKLLHSIGKFRLMAV